MLNIVMPIAGRGKRFADAGFSFPKPLIPISGVPMVEIVTANLRPGRAHRFIYVALEDHLGETSLPKVLRRSSPTCSIVPVDRVTEGAACTVLLAESMIDNDDMLVIANTDQWVGMNMEDFLAPMDADPALDGLIMTMKAKDNKWSYVGFGKDGMVNRVVEKQVISADATVGIYAFRRGRDFVSAARQMIAADERVNGEFYVAPVYNRLIAGGARIGTVPVGELGRGMWGLGVPEDLKAFVEDPILVARALMQAGR
jgi:NDP-sugar pyrophosphorylase family protein